MSLPCQFEHIFSVLVRLHSPPEIIGPVPQGLRMNHYIAGGEVNGPKLRGRIRAVGGDWLTLRPDGVLLLDVRTTLETEDGALVAVSFTGLSDLGEDAFGKFQRGEAPEKISYRAAPRFETAHPAYQWLNRLFALAVGEVDRPHAEVRAHCYAVR